MSDWTAAVDEYRKGDRTKDALYPVWLDEIDRLAPNLKVREHEEQATPLFTNGWSPQDAVEHLARVWVLKRWA